MKKPALTDPRTTVGVAIGLILSVGFFGPYLGVVMLPGWVVLLAWGLVRWRKKKPVSRVFNGALSVLLGVILFVGLVMLGQTRQVEHKMLWEVEGVTDGSSFCPAGEDEVRLRFVEFRGYFVTEYSKELAAFLRESGKREVTVRFDVTYDFFQVRGFHAVAVEGRRVHWEKSDPTDLVTCMGGAGFAGSGQGVSPYDWPW